MISRTRHYLFSVIAFCSTAQTIQALTATKMSDFVFSSRKDAVEFVLKGLQEKSHEFVPCGSLACQKDSLQRKLETAKVLGYAPFEEKPAVRNKKNKSKSDTNTNIDTQQQEAFGSIKYAIAVSDSVLFPEGGGQPSDRGILTIILQADNKNEEKLELSVVDAQNEQNVCILTCQAPACPDIAISPTSLALALESNPVILQEIDFDRRFDMMTQHSAQHLTSAIALNEFQILTHSFSLQENGLISYIDFKVDYSTTNLEECIERMKQVEALVNERIRQNLPMKPMWMNPDNPEFQAKVRSRLLPKGLEGKTLRLVEIGVGGDVDLNTCCGTHVPSLGVLQMVQFFKMEKVKSNILRVHFGAAKRLARVMEENVARELQLTNLLACPAKEHVSRLQSLLDEKRSRELEIKTLNEQLCSRWVKDVVEECKQNANVAVMDVGSTADVNFMIMLSVAVLERLGGNTDTEGVLLLFVSGAEGTDEGSFFLTGDATLVEKVGRKTAELLGGRGGGRNGRFQGKGTKIRSALDDVKQSLMQLKKETAVVDQ
jgi:misacylated tRNA(Ala) deacylase